ncbi:MAG: heme exporter protein CcmD [Alphaproteobacteria bacterium]|nr:heme exporter protein CcmD [Alphaproteobacteria bacterium]
MNDFLTMGGYAAFVWPAYGISAAALLGLVFYVLRRRAGARRRLAEIEGRADKTAG